MGSDLSQDTKEVRVAKAKCVGNYACALALLQKGVYRRLKEIVGCVQLNSKLKTQKMTTDMTLNKKGICDIPTHFDSTNDRECAGRLDQYNP